MRAAPTTMDLRLAPSAELGVARLLDWPGGAGHEPAAGADLVRAAGADPAESTAGDETGALVESGAGPFVNRTTGQMTRPCVAEFAFVGCESVVGWDGRPCGRGSGHDQGSRPA